MMQAAMEEYAQALRQGQKEYRELLMAGKSPYPVVLDEVLPEDDELQVVDVGLVEIPSERIIGVKSAGRIAAFTASFRPLLDAKSEFGAKWINLCAAHLGEAGITDPILCYEYLGNFYVQEGNKRVSVLRHFGSPGIPGNVKRVLPAASDAPRIRAYYEFIEFYKVTGLYDVQFRRPGDYARLLTKLGKKRTEVWSEAERRNFKASFHFFQEAFQEVKAKADGDVDLLPEEALLLWLDLFPFSNLKRLSATTLRKGIAALWEDMVSTTAQDSVKVQTKAKDESKTSLINRLFAGIEQLYVAFIHQMEESSGSAWVLGHEAGRAHLEEVFGDRIAVKSYYGASSFERTEACIDQAVADGAEVVFTTSPPLSRATLKAAVEYPKVRFFNCSVDQPYSSIRTYYGRLHEAKFITGAIAGAMAGEDRIGYIAGYPIFGVTASINAFALGARMTNPRAQLELRWSCLPGTPQADFLADGIRVLSNREAPTKSQMYMDFCNYGTYLMDDRGELVPLATPVWEWGSFYEFAIRSILDGGLRRDKGNAVAVNYWLGMDSGVIAVKISDKLPEGLRQLANILSRGLAEGSIDPFHRRIVAQDGTLKNDGSRGLSPNEILHMDWLCDSVIGQIPSYEEILPQSRSMVRELGIYRDSIPPEKEEKSRENFEHIR